MKGARTSGQSGKRKAVRKRDDLPKKAATRASDVYEAEDRDPAEELEAGRRYDVCVVCFDFCSTSEATLMYGALNEYCCSACR